MRINPKTIILDEMERSTIELALQQLIEKRRRNIGQINGATERGRRIMVQHEIVKARAEDLITRLKGA